MELCVGVWWRCALSCCEKKTTAAGITTSSLKELHLFLLNYHQLTQPGSQQPLCVGMVQSARTQQVIDHEEQKRIHYVPLCSFRGINSPPLDHGIDVTAKICSSSTSKRWFCMHHPYIFVYQLSDANAIKYVYLLVSSHIRMQKQSSQHGWCT